MSNSVDMDDDDIYPENDDYVPQESKMQDMEDEEEGEELESDSDVRKPYGYLELESDNSRTISTSSSTRKMSPRQNLDRVCISPRKDPSFTNTIFQSEGPSTRIETERAGQCESETISNTDNGHKTRAHTIYTSQY